MRIILPKTLIPEEMITSPLFFLLGPIRGGGDWQRTCYKMLEKRIPECWIANPARYSPKHWLMRIRERGPNRFARQLSWERFYLEMASRKGCIIAWLPTESKYRPRTDGGPYARDTLGELGEWRGRMMHGETNRFVLGGKPDFPGIDVITRNFRHALGNSFVVSSTLLETVERAIGIALSPDLNVYPSSG